MLWQLRTIGYRGQFFIAPFVLNTGGSQSNCPTVGTPLLRKIGALPDGLDRVAWENKKDEPVRVPSPLGELTSMQDWDLDRASDTDQMDEHFNLIGYGWSAFNFHVDLCAGMVNAGDISFDVGVNKLIAKCSGEIEPYINNPDNKKFVERELLGMIDARKNEKEIDELAKEWATTNRLV